jgi:hypothetical protein
MSFYPCSCTGCTDCSSTSNQCPDNASCLMVSDVTLFSDTSILPCGSSFSVAVGAASDLSVCDTTVNWGIVSYDADAFSSVSVNSSGVVSGTTTTAAQLNTFYKIVGKAICTETLLSSYFTVKISVRNACLDVASCPDGQECDKCSGTCLDEVDSELS